MSEFLVFMSLAIYLFSCLPWGRSFTHHLLRRWSVHITQILALFILYLYGAPTVLAQNTNHLPWSNEGNGVSSQWRMDRESFWIEDGLMRLNAPRDYGQAAIFADVEIGENMLWSGQVQLAQLPSARNTSYILLCSIGQDKQQQRYSYIGIEIGGKQKTVALVVLILQRKSSLLHIAQKEYLCLGKPDKLYTTEMTIDYQVRYARHKGWGLSVDYSNDYQGWRTLGLTHKYSEDIAPLNSFGFFCFYTPTHHQWIRFGRPNIIKSDTALDLTVGISEETNPDIEHEDSPLSAPYLSEVMANPVEGSSEYIELYNPNDRTLNLEGYELFIGKTLQSVKTIPLGGLPLIPPKGYLVLTSSPDQLINTYPSTPEESVFPIKLPKLPNTGFFLGLLDSREQTVDLIYYSTNFYPKGMKSKRGISLERKVFAPEVNEDKRNKQWAPSNPEQGGSPGQGASNTLHLQDNSATNDLEELNRLVQEPDVVAITVDMYDHRGYLLHHWGGDKAQDFALSFAKSPIVALRSTQQTRYWPVILLFSIKGKDDETIRLVFHTVIR